MDRPNESKTPPVAGPGKALQQARSDLRLSIDDVAAQLHLAPRQIHALESDDFANLPQPTYVRGYLRSYAQLLGLSPENILQSYAQAAGGHKRPKLAQGDVEQRAADKDGMTRWITTGVGLLLLALGYAWWQGQTPATEESVVAAGQGSAALADGAGGDSEPAPLPPDLLVEPAQENKPASSPVPSVPVPAKPEPARKPEPRTQPPVKTAPAAAAPRQPDATVAGTPVPPAGSAVDEKRVRLVLQVDAESWAEVRDANENRLLYQTVPAGRIVGLEGVPPFQVFLGNVDGVKVFIEGQAFDAARYKRGATARFSVGARQPLNP